MRRNSPAVSGTPALPGAQNNAAHPFPWCSSCSRCLRGLSAFRCQCRQPDHPLQRCALALQEMHRLKEGWRDRHDEWYATEPVLEWPEGKEVIDPICQRTVRTPIRRTGRSSVHRDLRAPTPAADLAPSAVDSQQEGKGYNATRQV